MTEFKLKCHRDSFALREPFVISRGTKTHANVVVAELSHKTGCVGRGEAVPYARYGETMQAVCDAICGFSGPFDRQVLRAHMSAGAARNAIDCAIVDLEAKMRGITPSKLLGLSGLEKVETAYTLSLGSPEAMAEAALRVPHLRLLKLKLGGAGDGPRMAAVRAARPDARLVADANEAWTEELLAPLMAAAAQAGVETVEQPLPANADAALSMLVRAVPVCADESAHVSADLAGLVDRYDAVNIKLDKAGGLTEALEMRNEARRLGLKVMIGSMVASSLGMAPALLLAQDADWVDLDSPLLLATDRAHGLRINDGFIEPPSSRLWG
ncbi:MAG: dipeptide epimerase [Hyphomicrobiaceae bacterium]|nr:dipeptide epimerase [Hyphomicrobiaceae bacterium]MCC0009965.1 dipeptide epimerase [Hyphomicrobiaceae bacterium]